MGDEGAIVIARALEDSSCPLRFLNLSTNHVSDEGARSLALACSIGQLTYLSLAGNELSLEGAHAVVDAVEVRYRNIERDERPNKEDTQANGDCCDREEQGYHSLEIALEDNAFTFSMWLTW